MSSVPMEMVECVVSCAIIYTSEFRYVHGAHIHSQPKNVF